MIRAAGFVCDVGRVVLIAEAREVMSELVNEHVFGEAAVDGGRRLIVEDSAAAVLLFVDQDLDEVVRCRRRGVAP